MVNLILTSSHSTLVTRNFSIILQFMILASSLATSYQQLATSYHRHAGAAPARRQIPSAAPKIP